MRLQQPLDASRLDDDDEAEYRVGSYGDAFGESSQARISYRDVGRSPEVPMPDGAAIELWRDASPLAPSQGLPTNDADRVRCPHSAGVRRSRPVDGAEPALRKPRAT